MKKTTLLTTILVSSTVLGGQVAMAAETPLELNTNAHVKFITDEDENNPTVPEVPGGGGETVPEVPGENGKPETPGGETPGVNGPLAIVFAPNFEFGEHVLAAKDLKVPAYSQIVDSKGKAVPHFVQVKDARGIHTGWDLKVKATQLASGDNKIEGATILLNSNHHFNDNGNGEVTTDMKEIKLDGKDEQNVMAAGQGNGQGMHSMQWGTNDTLATIKVTENKEEKDQLVNNDVNLFIPSKSLTLANVDEDYTSELTWTLTGNPKAPDSATPSTDK